MRYEHNIGITQDIDSHGNTTGYTLKLKRKYANKDSVLKDMRMIQNSRDMFNFILMLKEHTDQPQHILDMILEFENNIKG